MKITTRYLFLLSTAAVFFLAGHLIRLGDSGKADAATNYEESAVLNAVGLLPGVPLKGELYQIDSDVPTDGFLMKFTIRSEFGTFHPQSPDLAKTTLLEISAIKQLDEILKSEVFIEGLKKSGKEIGNEIKTLVTEPVQTAKGIGSGIGRFFHRTYRTAKTGVQKLGDIASEEDSAIQTSQGPGSKLPGADPKKTDVTSDQSLTEASMKLAGNTAINIFGYSDQRRQLAKNLSVDPYTTNQVLADKLDEVAWAAFAGGLGVTAAKMIVPASMALSVSTTLTDWVWDVPPGDLRVFNQEELLAMGVTQESVDRFFRNRWYTFTLQGRLVRALMTLDKTEKRSEVIALALTVTSESQARFVTEAVEMLGHYNKNVLPVARIDVYTTITGRIENGTIIIPAPLDYVSWNRRLDTFTGRDEFSNTKRHIFIRGRFSPVAKKELIKKGWIVTENALNK